MDTENWQSRTEALLGVEAVKSLGAARVLVAGVGGVGGYVAETLVRSGIGAITIVDADTVAESNINRQLIATCATVGMPKAELWRQRLLSINPQCNIEALQLFITPDNLSELFVSDYDYVADCIDTVAPKVALLRETVRRRIPVVSSMGAGGRLDPSKIALGNLWDTREDGLARAVRQRLKALGERPNIKVVWSSESPRRSALLDIEGMENKRSSFGILATIPAIFGLFMANRIIVELSSKRQ